MHTQSHELFLSTRTFYFDPLRKDVTILMQDENGPCMLLAVFNTLVLRGDLSIDPGTYKSSQLLTLLKSISPHMPDISHLVRGCDINPYFSGCADFRDPPKFLKDLSIPMLHAMLPDPSTKTFNIVSNLDYDSLTLRLTEPPTDENKESLRIMTEWWTEIQPQVTHLGLETIEVGMREGDLAVFFRANHFSVLYKTLGRVFSLVTDTGFTGTPHVWQTLPNKRGDTVYFDNSFLPTPLRHRTNSYPKKHEPPRRYRRRANTARPRTSHECCALQ